MDLTEIINAVPVMVTALVGMYFAFMKLMALNKRIQKSNYQQIRRFFKDRQARNTHRLQLEVAFKSFVGIPLNYDEINIIIEAEYPQQSLSKYLVCRNLLMIDKAINKFRLKDKYNTAYKLLIAKAGWLTGYVISSLFVVVPLMNWRQVIETSGLLKLIWVSGAGLILMIICLLKKHAIDTAEDLLEDEKIACVICEGVAA